jgi:hypothetical protein
VNPGQVSHGSGGARLCVAQPRLVLAIQLLLTIALGSRPRVVARLRLLPRAGVVAHLPVRLASRLL